MTSIPDDDTSFAGRGGCEGSGASPGGSSQTPPAVDAYAPVGDFLRGCTCYPTEAPIPCQHKYAFEDCWAAALEMTPAELESNAIGSFWCAMRNLAAWHNMRGTRPTGGYFT